MWLPNPSVSEVDEHASLLTHAVSISTLLNINTEQRIPPSPIVLLWPLPRRVCACLVIMRQLMSTLCAYAYYSRVFMACVCRLQRSSS